MRLIDYIYILGVLLFVIVGSFCVIRSAKKIRNDSINDYIKEKNQRQSKFVK